MPLIWNFRKHRCRVCFTTQDGGDSLFEQRHQTIISFFASLPTLPVLGNKTGGDCSFLRFPNSVMICGNFPFAKEKNPFLCWSPTTTHDWFSRGKFALFDNVKHGKVWQENKWLCLLDFIVLKTVKKCVVIKAFWITHINSPIICLWL